MELLGVAIIVVGLVIAAFANSQREPGPEREPLLMNVAIGVMIAGLALMGFVENFSR